MNSKQRRKARRAHLKFVRRAEKCRGPFFGIERTAADPPQLRGFALQPTLSLEEAIRIAWANITKEPNNGKEAV